MITDAIIGNLVGDYLLQNSYLALNKKKSSLICAVHCAIWTLSVCLFSGWWIPWVIVALFVSHFIQDRTQIISRYMDAVGQKSSRTGICAPWSAIFVDNVFHIVTLWAISKAI